MSKIRAAIPPETAVEVMFASDNTCCVCRERGKALQIHHVDENPSNNVFTNLALLCLECHDDTQIRGGFGRKLNATLVTKYRDEWLERVKNRRDKADEMAITRSVSPSPMSPSERSEKISEIVRDPPLAYINSLPAFREELLRHAQPEWDSGVTSRMVEASYAYIDAMQSVLVTLTNYYSHKQFGDKTPERFISDAIASRFEWHHAHSEPHGPGTGGTIVRVLVSGGVMSDVDRMVEDVVMSLVGYDDQFRWEEWSSRWNPERSNKSIQPTCEDARG